MRRGARDIVIPAAGGGGAGNFSAGVSTDGNTVGTTGVVGSRIEFVGSNNITLSQSVNGQSATISIIGGAGAAADGVNIIAAGTQTANTTGTVLFQNSNGVTFGMSNSSVVTATVKTDYQSSNANYLTSQSNQNVTAQNGGFAFQTLSFSNANGVSFGTSAGSAITASYTVPTVTNSSWTVSDSATSATVGRLAFTASNGLTLTLSTSNNGNHTVIGSYTVPTVTNSSWTVSDAATSGTVARLAFTNLNGVTLSLSTGAGGSHTIVGSHNALTSQSTDFNAITLGGNTSGTTTFHATNNQTIWLNGGNNITLSGNGSTITISQQLPYIRRFQPFPPNNNSFNQDGQALGHCFAFNAIAPVTASQVNQYISMSVSTSSNSSHAGTLSFSAGIYSLNASTWSLASSGSASYQWTNTSNNSTSVIQGWHMITIPMNVNMTPGYWMMILWSQSTTANANWFTASNLWVSGQAGGYSGLLGAAASASNQPLPGWGYINGAASFNSAMPATVHSSSISAGLAGGFHGNLVDFQIDAY